QSDRIVLDLAAVDFMDTSSLAVIVGHWKKLTARDGILALAGARYRYTKTLWITGLADRLPRYDTVEQAVAAVSDGGGGGEPARAGPEPEVQAGGGAGAGRAQRGQGAEVGYHPQAGAAAGPGGRA